MVRLLPYLTIKLNHLQIVINVEISEVIRHYNEKIVRKARLIPIAYAESLMINDISTNIRQYSYK